MRNVAAWLLAAGLILQSMPTTLFAQREGGTTSEPIVEPLESPQTELEESEEKNDQNTEQSTSKDESAEAEGNQPEQDEGKLEGEPEVSPHPTVQPTVQPTPQIPQATEPADQPSAEQMPAQKQEETVTQVVPDPVGSLLVELNCTLPLEKNAGRLGQITAVLLQDGVEISRDNFIVSDKDINQASVKFIELQPGTVELRLSGSFFAYAQVLEIQPMLQTIKLTDKTVVFDLNQAHPGTFCYGDLNADGIVDDKDSRLLVNALSSRSEDPAFDLNGDGQVSLTDLHCLAYSVGQSQTEATVTRSLILDETQVQAEFSANTQPVQGSVAELLEGTGSLTLAPQSEADLSEENPVEFSLQLDDQNTYVAEGLTIDAPVSDNTIQAGSIVVRYLDENNEEQEEILNFGEAAARLRSAAAITQEPDGTLLINLGRQVAIKKITIRVTQSKSSKLADIGKVEFLNDMESRIAPPQMNVPENLTVENGNKKFMLRWDNQPNVSGYQVEITHGEKTIVVPAVVNWLSVTSFGQEKLKNKEVYQVRVQSVNGEWSSGYGNPVEAVPVADKAPDAPENVAIQSGYQKLTVTWKTMPDTDTYTLYYRVQGQSEYQRVEGLTQAKKELTGLQNKTTYEIYLTGTNECGTSKNSEVYIGTTQDIDPAITSNYKRINTPLENGGTAHIASVSYPSHAPASEMTVVDDDYTTSWFLNSWDGGGYNSPKPSPIIEFDQPYEMNRITVIPDAGQVGTYAYAKTRYWDESGNVQTLNGGLSSKRSSNGQVYYELWFDQPFTTKKIQVNLAQYWAGNNSLSISEMKFYYYDSLDQEVSALFADDLHVTLAEAVTAEQISALIERANTPDEVSGEYHPRRELLLRELELADSLLNNQAMTQSLKIDAKRIKSKDSSLGISGGLNSWQPLGVTAHANEEIVVYVGQKNTAQGTSLPLRLIATQFHAESGKWSQVVVNNLKQGQNIVTIPTISNLAAEHGGSLYVEYTGNNENAEIVVRVSGGTSIPVLDLSNIQEESARRQAVSTYLETLNTQVPQISAAHDELHWNQPDTQCDFPYQKQQCILQATEIVVDQVMLSVASEQILAGVNQKLQAKGQPITLENQTETLLQSLNAMEQMVSLFYHHKGLTDQTVPQEYGTKNKLPVSRLNLRYMRMFAGAFMYAGGLHIGIEWDSIPGLAQAEPIVSDNGKYISGQLFGWGIAHEIGHIINQPSYAIAEITNNYFSILAQADESNEKVRFKYEDVYEKVTSKTVGRAPSVFTSLAMYWQLHLAYDDGYNFKVYDNYQDQFNNLIFARIDAYARNPELAPNGLSLGNGLGKDDVLIRLACAAAEKNLLAFFENWGLVCNEETRAYAKTFPEETRNICYITDQARVYRLEGGTNAAAGAKVQAQLEHLPNTKQVTLTLTNNAENAEAMLGYEIYRNGQVIGFVAAHETASVFVDQIATLNNRAFTYEVVGYDKLLNRTETTVLDPIKVSHDGSLSKKNWTVSTNMSSADDEVLEPSDDYPEGKTRSAIDRVVNDDCNDLYRGSSSQSPEIILQFQENLTISGIKFTALNHSGKTIKNIEVYLSADGQNWQLMDSGTLTYENGVAIHYFSKEGDSWMYTYDTAMLKILVKGQKEIEVSEIDILGPAGDNVELLENGMGLLKSDYVLDPQQPQEVIPAGSLIFTGEYKGNPVYNAIKLYNEKQELVEGTQVLFAEVPERGELGEISSGTWIYYIEPELLAQMQNLPQRVRAELYRVDDAHSSQGERLVSDTLLVSLPAVLPEIELQGTR